MADGKNDDLGLSLGVYPDEKSVVDAANTISKKVLNKFKDGHIDIPVELSTKFDKSNKKVTDNLIKAQEEFIDEYNKLSSKGFSASTKELKNFVKLYDEFKAEMRTSHQTGSKQNLAFRDFNLNEIFQDYHKQMDDLAKDVAKSVAQNGLKLSRQTKTLIKMPNMSKQKSIRTDDKQLAKDFDDYVEGLRKAYKEKHEVTPNRMGSTPPKGYKRDSSIDPGRTSERLMRLSEYSAHGSNWADELARTLKEEIKKSIADLKVYGSKKEYEEKTGRKIEDFGVKVSNTTTQDQWLKDIVKNLGSEITANIRKSEAGDETITLDVLKDQAAMLKSINAEAGKDLEDSYIKIKGAVEDAVYGHKTTGKVGGTSLEEGQERGVGPGHERTNAMVKELYAIMEEWWEVTPKMEAMARRIANDAMDTSKAITKTKGKRGRKSSALEKYDEVRATEEYKQSMDTKAIEQGLKDTVDATKEVARESKRGATATERQAQYDKLATDETLVSNDAASKKATENIKATEHVGEEVQRTDTTGTDSEYGKQEVINAIKGVKQEPAKPIETEKKTGKVYKQPTSSKKKDKDADKRLENAELKVDLGPLSTIHSVLVSILASAVSVEKDVRGIADKFLDRKDEKKDKNKIGFDTEQAQNPMKKVMQDYSMEMKAAWDTFNDSVVPIKALATIPGEIAKTVYKYDTPRAISKEDLLNKKNVDLAEKTANKAQEINEKKPQVYTPKVMDTTGANTLLPAVITEFDKVLRPLQKASNVIRDASGGVGKKEAEAIEASIKARKEEEEQIKKDQKLREATAKKEEKLRQERAQRDKLKQPETPEVITPGDKLGVSWQDALVKAFSGKSRPSSKAAEIMNANATEQARMRAERMERYGDNKGKDLTDTGDIASVRRTKTLFGWNYKNDEKNRQLFQDVKLTPGETVDTDKLAQSLQQVLNGPEMFKAQTGGWFKNIIGPMTGYLGQDSLEKTRAQAEGLNQVMADVRNEVMTLLQSIKTKQMTLEGMKDDGQLKLDATGRPTKDSTPLAQKTFTDWEEQKGVLRAALAEVRMIDDVVAQTGGRIPEIIKQLGFVMPELIKENTILQNINNGLDKNGKALKFQTRTAEILNYSFQLMSRHIGQMVKNWMMQLNPLTQIKKLFSDFMSYDTKWQRTMNVIKYNLRRVFKPMMEWIAQQLVNIIGLGNALMKGLGKAFGKNWDLFDKGAAQAEKSLEDLEAQANNVTLGFDELHDIGSDNSGANDLSGDIYTPQWTSLYDTIENFGKKIGDVLNGIKQLTEGWNFWTWLAVIGGAIAGFKILKWLIGLFSKKNPLESVAKGFSFLEKAVGWALLIWAFTAFTKALTEFVECMKTADWEDIAKSLIMLGGAFAELVGSIILLEWGSLGMDPKAMAGLAALVWVFGEFVKAIIPFIELMWSICDLNDEGKEFEILAGSLSMLALAFVDLIGGVAGAEWVTKLIGLDWQSLLGLAAVVGVLDLFVSALVPFIECIASIPEGEKIETIVGTFGALITAFLALAGGVATLSRAFKTMDWKAIGQFAVITIVFDLFMATLVPFVNAIKDIPFETLAGGAILIAGAFIALGTAVGIMGAFFKGLSLGAFIELIALLAVMGGLIYVITEFAKALKDLSAEQIYAGLALLAGTIITVSVAIGVLAAVFTALVTSGVGAIAIVLLGALLGIFALIIDRMAEFVRALGEAGEGIKLILEGVQGCIEQIGIAIQGIILTIGLAIMGIVTSIATGIATIIQALADGINTILTGLGTFIETIGNTIVNVISGVADAIATVLQPILDFIDGIIGKITELAKTVAHEIGETIRTIIETVGKVITGIIDSIMNAIPNLLDAILRFCREIGPAIENSVDAILRSVTKLINFLISGVEYLLNTLFIDAVNGFLGGLPFGVGEGFKMSHIEIARFVPQYETGTNYVPNDGLAYLHQGEAVIPKKYNQPYQQQGLSPEERAYMEQMVQTMRALDNTMQQGINVKGEFRQRGNDLVATVEKNKSKQSNNVLNNRVYAR